MMMRDDEVSQSVLGEFPRQQLTRKRRSDNQRDTKHH
jgi:hypothetical protein